MILLGGNLRSECRLKKENREKKMEQDIISNNDEYEMALQRIDQLMGAEADTPELDELKSLTLLVEQYENIHYPVNPPTLLSKIKFRLEQLGWVN